MTPARDTAPTRRKVTAEERIGPRGMTRSRPFVVELGERFMKIRPLGCRSGGPAEVTIPYAAQYERALMARAAEQARVRKAAKRARRRAR